MLPKYTFCRCMKPWKICIDKKNSPKIDVRELINTKNIGPYLTSPYLHYDFINKKFINDDFVCRFNGKIVKNQNKY